MNQKKSKFNLEKLIESLKDFLKFRWNPNKNLVYILGIYILVVFLYWISFEVITMEIVAPSFILFGPVALFGVGTLLPIVWTVKKKNRSLKDIGITKENLWISLILTVIFSIIQYTMTLGAVNLPSIEVIVPLATMATAVGFFENLFFRGWMQNQLEESFGGIIAILGSSGFYALYHIGYGMNWNEIGFLFIIGLVYSIVFRLTRNFFILWPFLTPMGGFYANITSGLIIPFDATYGFLLVIGLMVQALIVAGIIHKKRREE